MQKKVLLTAILLLIAPLCAIVILGFYYGVFDPVIIHEEDIGPYTMVYLSRLGDYRESSAPLYKIHRDLAENYALSAPLGFGIYYNNPATTPTPELRSDLGALLPAPADPALIAKLSGTYKIRLIARTPCYVASFPYKNQASPLIGAVKVYPALTAHLEIRHAPMKQALEIYNIKEGRILYVIPKQ